VTDLLGSQFFDSKQRLLANFLSTQVRALYSFVQQKAAKYTASLILSLLVHEIVGVNYRSVHIDVCCTLLSCTTGFNFVKLLDQVELILVWRSRVNIEGVDIFNKGDLVLSKFRALLGQIKVIAVSEVDIWDGVFLSC